MTPEEMRAKLGGLGFSPGRGAGANGWLFGGDAANPQNARWRDADYLRAQAQSGIANAQNRQTPQADSTLVNNAYSQRLQDVINRTNAVASGQQMGAGELAARRQGQMALSNAIGAANMQRGASAGNAGRAAARAAAGIGLQTSGMAQQAALNDQMGANQTLLGAIGQGQGQEVARAGLDQQTRLANLQARLQAMGLNDQAALGYLGALGQQNQSEMNARLAQEQLNAQDKGVLGGLLSQGGTIAAAYYGGKG